MKICLLSTDDLFLSDIEFNAALSSIPFGERDKEELLKIKNRRSACDSLLARAALRRLCDQCDFGNIEKTGNGKPYFSKKDAPFFSLSHTKGIAAAATCDRCDGLVGIDVEAIRTDRKLNDIADRFFTPEELARYQKDETPESFYSIWTEKEARVKLFGRELASELSNSEKEALYFYRYKVTFAGTHAILCVAFEKKQEEIIIIKDDGFHIEKII